MEEYLVPKLANVIPRKLSEQKRVDYKLASVVRALATSAAPEQRLDRRDARVLVKVAELPNSQFVDKHAPSYVKTQRDEIRDYAETIKALQRVRLEVRSRVPGIAVELARDLAVVDLRERGFQHDLILQVKLSARRAEHDGTLTFSYGDFTVSVEVKKGQSRDSILSRLEAKLQRQQGEQMPAGRPIDGGREFFLHRVRAPQPDVVHWG